MKKNIAAFVLCVLSLLLAACTSTGSGSRTALTLRDAIEQSAERTAGELPKGSRVAIVAFESENDRLSEYIMEELNGALFDRGIEVADRQNLEYALQELNFQMSMYVSDESALSIGKFLGADIVITGALTGFGDMYRFRANALNVETAARVSMSRFDVRNDQTLRRMTGK